MRRSPALMRTMPFLLGWAISLWLPAIDVGMWSAMPMLSGWALLLNGYRALPAYQFGWLANFALFGVLAGLSFWGMGWRWLIGWSALLLLTTLQAFDLFLRPAFWAFKGAGPGFWLWTISNLGAAATGFMVAARRGKLPR
ncbi:MULTISPECIES: hypothetical protein [unclassified Sphingomonas]|uniref:hypothetical protein n=1 Tax=unclassified Sphingomonas TaxID=196159 RepID=UPI0012E19A16|nr:MULTISPECIES: hypothetical protein [unclassified Sphingomonas]